MPPSRGRMMALPITFKAFLQVLVLFLLLCALPHKSHSHFKMSSSIFVEIARITTGRLNYSSVAFSVYPIIYPIFSLTRAKIKM
jgi:hypothetical protein